MERAFTCGNEAQRDKWNKKSPFETSNEANKKLVQSVGALAGINPFNFHYD